MAVFDRVDGGIPATFLDGPKAGHVGVVTPVNDMPPKTLGFYDGNSLIYKRHAKAKVTALDGLSGETRRYRGVSYRVDPDCDFMREVAKQVAEAKIEKALGRVDTL